MRYFLAILDTTVEGLVASCLKLRDLTIRKLEAVDRAFADSAFREHIHIAAVSAADVEKASGLRPDNTKDSRKFHAIENFLSLEREGGDLLLDLVGVVCGRVDRSQFGYRGAGIK